MQASIHMYLSLVLLEETVPREQSLSLLFYTPHSFIFLFFLSESFQNFNIEVKHGCSQSNLLNIILIVLFVIYALPV